MVDRALCVRQAAVPHRGAYGRIDAFRQGLANHHHYVKSADLLLPAQSDPLQFSHHPIVGRSLSRCGGEECGPHDRQARFAMETSRCRQRGSANPPRLYDGPIHNPQPENSDPFRSHS